MPTYDLRCRSCGESYERFLTRLLRDEDLVCPSCGSTDIKRGVGGGVVLGSSAAKRDAAAGGCGPSPFS